MYLINRKKFLQLAAMALIGNILPFRQKQTNVLVVRDYNGTNLSGWEINVGDGIWNPPEEEPINLNDIETVHESLYSELRANILRRRIMAHNITVKKVWDNDIFTFVHTSGYKFRMPYIPVQSNWDLNAQTLEGGLFLWDGTNTKLAYGIGFEWVLNPWDISGGNFGDIRAWTSEGQWVNVGHITPDMAWHTVTMKVDFRKKETTLAIDGKFYTSYFAGTSKPNNWAAQNVAILQAEIISIWPGDSDIHALHKAQFSDWWWHWEPYLNHYNYLPFIIG